MESLTKSDFTISMQVRRATLSQFWDCDAIIMSLVLPQGSIIDTAIIKRVQPIVCPSLLHWLSFPRGENVLLDVFAKPVRIISLKVEQFFFLFSLLMQATGPQSDKVNNMYLY